MCGVGAAASATLTVKKNCPGAVGVPDNAPDDGFSDIPGGRDEDGASVHVNVPVPPLAVNAFAFVYVVPTLPGVIWSSAL